MNSILSTLLILMFLFVSCSDTNAAEAIIDLSDKDIESEMLKLDGKWEFYWQEFVDPQGKAMTTPILVDVPNSWHRVKPTFGYATYKAVIKIPKEHPTRLAIKARKIKMAHRLYINGQLIAEKGRATQYKDTTTNEHVPYISEFVIPPDVSELQLILHVANYTYIKSGISTTLLIGTPANAYKYRENKLFWQIFISGALFIISLYHFSYYLSRRKEKAALYFSLFCIGIALRMIVSEEKYIFSILPNISTDFVLSLELFASYFSLPLLHIFIAKLYPQDFYFLARYRHRNNFITCENISKTIFLALTIGWLLTPLSIHSKFLVPGEVYSIFMLSHILLVAYRVVYNKRQGALLFSAGFVVVFCAGINDALYERDIVKTGFLLHFGVLMFVFAQSSLFSKKLANAFNESEQFNATLERKVQERTKEVERITQENRRLNKSMTTALEDERRYIAKEMHDGVNAYIISAKLQAQTIISKLKHGGDEIEMDARLKKLVDRLEDIYQKARNVVRRLRPEAIDALGLKKAVENLLSEYDQTLEDCEVTYQIDKTADETPDEICIIIYRIIQESMTNIVKHSQATKANIKLSIKDQIVLRISDNGKGFERSESDGIGLISMRERAMHTGGDFSITSNVGEGTEVQVKIPMPN